MAWVEAQDMTVLETVGQVDMEFMITRGDRSTSTRAFTVTRNLSATEGMYSLRSTFTYRLHVTHIVVMHVDCVLLML